MNAPKTAGEAAYLKWRDTLHGKNDAYKLSWRDMGPALRFCWDQAAAAAIAFAAGAEEPPDIAIVADPSMPRDEVELRSGGQRVRARIEVVPAPGDRCGNTGKLPDGTPCPGCRACA